MLQVIIFACAVTSIMSIRFQQFAVARRDASSIPDRLVGNYKINFMGNFIDMGNQTLSSKIMGAMRANIKEIMKINKLTENQIEWADDHDCAELIEHVHSKELRAAFENEGKGEYKSDICRLAQLAERGGYYVDNDMQAVQDMHQYIPAHTSFVSVIAAWNSHGDPDDQEKPYKNIRDELFNSFIGAAPGHPIIQRALNLTLEHYSKKNVSVPSDLVRLEKEVEMSRWDLGPSILRQAYEWWADLPLGASQMVAGESYHATKPVGLKYSYLLDEVKINKEYFVRDDRTSTVIFNSRIAALS